MATAAHTSGPWTHDGLAIFGGDEKRVIIASVSADRRDEAIAERRANLDMMTFGMSCVEECTRAGGLLWMAEQWFEFIGHKSMNASDFAERLDAARAAISKATGQA